MPKQAQTNEIDAILRTGKRIRDFMCRAQMAVLGNNPQLESMRDLTLQQMATAMIALERGPLSLGQLANFLGVSAASASAMVDRLIEKDVLTRLHSETDRRKIEIRISQAAERHLQAVQEAMRMAMDSLTNKLGPQTTHQWFDVMSKIAIAMDALEAEGEEHYA
ncbi:MAG: MarR family transcriptional regulator [Verrucomicrobia bacterium]|nr:MarR family transcriptional regulator [Verrucomicrobiota bacterium]